MTTSIQTSPPAAAIVFDALGDPDSIDMVALTNAANDYLDIRLREALRRRPLRPVLEVTDPDG
jgi:hypothetical protein